jgi:hypothetical protein
VRFNGSSLNRWADTDIDIISGLKDEHDFVECAQEARDFLSTLGQEEENIEEFLVSAACDFNGANSSLLARLLSKSTGMSLGN